MKRPAGANPLPIRLIMLATALALALIASLGWYVWDSVQSLRAVQARSFRLVELTGEITYLNEALWVSARLGTRAEEGNWLERYHRLAARRRAALEEFERLATSEFQSSAAQAGIAVASRRLAEIEQRALARARRGDAAAGASLLAGEEYLRQGEIAAEAATEVIGVLKRQTQNALDAQQSSGKLVIAAVALAVSLLLFTWVVSLRISAALIARRRREERERLELTRRNAFIADVRGALTKGANLQAVVDAMVQHLEAALARVWLLDPDEQVLVLEASAGLHTHPDGAHSSIPVGEFKIGRIAQDRRPHLTNNVSADGGVRHLDWARQEGITAFAGYPLTVEDRLVGVMAMFSRRPLSESTLHALGSVADTIAQGIQREHAEALTRRYAQDLVQANARLEVQAAKLARTAEELALARDAALESASLKSQFLANVSHEIRTPMTGIIGMTELAMDTSLSPEQRDYLAMIRSSAHSLLTLINGILDFSKIESGKLDFESAPFGLRLTLDDVLRPLAQQAADKGLRLSSEVAPEVPDELVGDAGRFRQIVVNLVGNAIKFTERGEIDVRAVLERREDHRAVVQISVSDTGIGIPRDKRHLIFQPFVQADGSTTRKYGGTGLGLAICQHLVRLMGGSIWVDGEPGVGSMFTFSLPFELQPSSQAAPPGEPARELLPATNGRPRRLRILMAEDNVVNQKLVARLLEKRGHTVVAAANGLEALEALEREPFDIVLMDVQMPAMGGLEATTAIRHREREAPYLSGPHVPIVAMTASAMKGDRERCLAAGMDGYISKPFRHDELFELIEGVAAARPERAGVAGD